MKKYYDNWKALTKTGRVLSIPGIIVVGLTVICLSPIIIVGLIIGFTMDVFEWEWNNDDDYGGCGY